MAAEVLDVIWSEMSEIRTCDRCGALLPPHSTLRLCFDCQHEALPTPANKKAYWADVRDRLP
jgi:ribosomal protein L40E